MRKCSKCENLHDNKHSWCRPCLNQNMKIRRLQNPEAYASSNRKNVKKIKQRKLALTNEAKSRPCADCNVKYPPYVMQFDHITGDKFMSISQMVSENKSTRLIEKEILKCEVVCANCHAVRTYNRRQSGN